MMSRENNNGVIRKKKNLFDDNDEDAAGTVQDKGSGKITSELKISNGIAEEMDITAKSFAEHDLQVEVITALNKMGYHMPTKIQAKALEYSLKDGDMTCLSETGSGKTLSFLLPIVNSLVKKCREESKYPAGYALILAPTRELCIQIQEYLIRFKESGIEKCTSVVLHGGADTKMKQVLELVKKPTIIVGTPGRILDHLENTKGFHLNSLKYLVLDEADKLLNLDFEKQINQILNILPKQRNAYLYSATLTSKVEKLQRVSLVHPTTIEVNSKYKTVSQLQEWYIFIPSKWKDCYLVSILNKFKKERSIVFMKTCLGTQRLYLVLKELKFNVQCLHGNLSQTQREKSLQNFRTKKCQILICTDVASRGIDISGINLVINYDLCPAKDYIHRVGRTARIGEEGKAISIVTQYDVEVFQEIEKRLGKKIEEYRIEESEALVFLQLLDRCHQEVSRKMRNTKHTK